MQMRDGLASIWAMIDDHAKASREPGLRRHLPCDQEQVPKGGLILL